MKTNSSEEKSFLNRLTGFSAFSENYPIYTTGKTIPELMDNALEAANLCFEDRNVMITQENLKFEVDFKQFF